MALVSSFGATLASSREAQAGNFDTFFLGNEAAMQAGAATADARRTSAVWYNPAGLAKLDHSSIDASVTALSLRLGEDMDLESAVAGSETTRLQRTSLSIVPAALSYTRRLSWAGVGFGLFVPNQESLSIRTRLRAPGSPGVPSNETSIDTSSTSQEYYAGPALAVDLSERLRLGFALFAHYRTQLEQTTLQVAEGGSDEPGFVVTHATDDSQSFGVQPVVGVQLETSTDWHFGLVLRAPTVRVYRNDQFVEQSLIAGGDFSPPSSDTEFSESVGFSSAIVAPLRVHVGVARTLGDGQLAAEASYRAPLSNEELFMDQRGVFNARVGGQASVGDGVALGGGVFSDRSATRLATDENGRDIDNYGVSLGVQLDTPYGVSFRKGEPLEPPRPLIFRTTLVVSYQLGVGQLRRLQLVDDGDELFLTDAVEDVVVHQVVFNVGATLLD